jgi:hypothetical protein
VIGLENLRSSAYKFVGNETQIAQRIRKAVLVELRAESVTQACCLRNSYLSPRDSENKSNWIRDDLLLERIDRTSEAALD